MCGIIGLINASYASADSKYVTVSYMKSSREFLSEGMIAGGVRGLDSTGVFQIDKLGNPYLHKLPVAAHLFVGDRATIPFLTDASVSPITVCHVRAATTGRISMNNAHPFQVFSDDGKRSILGVHNGTLSGWTTVAGAAASKYTVDSEWALAHIANKGLNAFEDFFGSYSFVWWDMDKPGELCFARNSERPMCFLRTKDKKHILFGSEPGLLYWIATRNGIEVEENVYKTSPDKYYVIDTTKKTLEWEDRGDLPKKATAIVPVKNTYHNPYYSRLYDDPDSPWDEADYVDTRKEKTVNNLKAILSKVRNAPVVEETLLDKALTESLEKACLAGEESEEDYADQMLLFTAKPDWYSTSLATMEEQSMAKELRSLGDIVEFEGQIFDDQTCEIVGDVTDYSSSGADAVFTATLRGEKEVVFENYYKDRVNYCVIIGARMDPTNQFNEFILAPLNEKGAAKYQELLAS